MSLFRIKICGVTTQADALVAADAGADAIGLNFYPASRRYVSPDDAHLIADALPRSVARVGVFVNSDPSEVRAIAESVRLDAVQLHGDERPEALQQLGDVPVVKAFRLGGTDMSAVRAFLEHCKSLACTPAMVLLDAFQAGSYGGTGARLDWRSISEQCQAMNGVPVILAGGLTPENVREAVDLVQPAGVDTASGVESSPGQKDHSKIQRFVAAARDALGGVELHK